MTERRRRGRATTKKGDRRHPLREVARLRLKGQSSRRKAVDDARTGENDERDRLTVQLPRATVEKLRNAVYWTPELTIAGFIAQCIDDVISRMEAERGAKFPHREKALRPGRPKSKPA